MGNHRASDPLRSIAGPNRKSTTTAPVTISRRTARNSPSVVSTDIALRTRATGFSIRAVWKKKGRSSVTGERSLGWVAMSRSRSSTVTKSLKVPVLFQTVSRARRIRCSGRTAPRRLFVQSRAVTCDNHGCPIGQVSVRPRLGGDEHVALVVGHPSSAPAARTVEMMRNVSSPTHRVIDKRPSEVRCVR